MLWAFHLGFQTVPGQWRIQRGGGGHRRPPPQKKKKWMDLLLFFWIPFGIRLHKNKAQIARGSVKDPIAGPGLDPGTELLESSVDPGRKGLRTLRSWCALAHIKCCAPSKSIHPCRLKSIGDGRIAIYYHSLTIIRIIKIIQCTFYHNLNERDFQINYS